MLRFLGSVQEPRLLWPLAQHLPQDTWKRVRSSAPSPTKAGRASWHQEGPGCLKSLGGIKMKWERHRGGIHPLGLWKPARSLPEKSGSREPGEKGEELGCVGP